MPHGDKIFSSTNTVGTKTRYTKGTTTISKTYEGLCKALAVLWCEKVLNGTRDVISKPDEFRAGSLQFHFEKAWDSDLIFGLASLKSEHKLTDTPVNCLVYINNHPGTYQIKVSGHAIAVHVTGSDYYFYDSESGLWKYNSAITWANDIIDEYFDGKNWTAWRLAKK